MTLTERTPLKFTIFLALGFALGAPAVMAGDCDSGASFSILLKGIDPPGPEPQLPDETIVLPCGRKIYALLTSGYGQNKGLDQLIFFNLGRFVLANDGYVQWAWWNNLLGPYLERPLHKLVFDPTPGDSGSIHLLGFGPDGIIGKGIPRDDYQYQSDARQLLRRIRSENPDAIIVVAGHSMGGNAVARLGSELKDVKIDLLAPIDPVGNRTLPEAPFHIGGIFPPPSCLDPATQGDFFCQRFNWTRWRATHEFRGYRNWDCVRVGPFCRDFDPSPFEISYKCGPIGPWLDRVPLFATLAPIACPRAFPYTDNGTQLAFGGNIRRLYHRWQREFLYPFDFRTSYNFRYSGGTQAALPQNPPCQNPQACNPNATCHEGLDPRQNTLACHDNDGHGEIIGQRGDAVDPTSNDPLMPYAERVQNVDQWHALGHRQALQQLENAPLDEEWMFTPRFPHLDMVTKDLIAILEELLEDQGESLCESDTTPPTTLATPSPSANGAGWHDDDVVVSLAAQDEAGGSGVTEITFELIGAESAGPITVPGDSVELTLAQEGITTVRFSARDCRNAEAQKEFVVRIDKTAPELFADVMPPANAHGWHRSDVLVTFSADDLPPPGAPAEWASGVVSVSDPVWMTTEGANQQVVGTATDAAGNSSTLVVVVNIDKTAPELFGLPGDDCRLWPPNHRLVHVASVIASDGLSGVDPNSLNVEGTSNEPETGPGAGNTAPDVLIQGGEVQLRAERSGGGSGRIYSLTASVADLAGNRTTADGTCVVPHSMGKARRSRR